MNSGFERMGISDVTWRGGSIDDAEILQQLDADLASILNEINGFILHHGALHVRGANSTPQWHSLRTAMRGPTAFHTLYKSVHAADIPFAQDQLGDQFLLREGQVLKLAAETGDVELFSHTLDDFFRGVGDDIETFLNVGLGHSIQPGQLLLAYPPFVFRESGAGASLKPLNAADVILFHADLARQIRDVPDGATIEFKLAD